MSDVLSANACSVAQRIASCASTSAVIEQGLRLDPVLRPLAAGLTSTLREIAEAEARREQKARQRQVAGGQARARQDAAAHEEWRRLALRHAQRLRAADPGISQVDLADSLIAAFPGRLPKREAVVRRIRAWERAGELARCGASRG